MPGTIVTVQGGATRTLLGLYHAPLVTLLRQQAGIDEKELLTQYLFAERNYVNRTAVAFGGVTAVGEMQPTPENGQPSVTDYKELEPTQLFYKKFSNQVVITDDMLEKGNFDEAAAAVRGLTKAYYTTVQRFQESFYVHAIMGHTSFTNGIHSYDTTVGDGKALFATDHPYRGSDSTATQSNRFTNGATQGGIETIITAMQKFEGDTENLLNITPRTILIPNDARLKRQVFTALGSVGLLESNGNAWNYQLGSYNIVILRYADTILRKLGWTGDLPFVILDDKVMEDFTAAVFGNFKTHKVIVTADPELERTKYTSRAEFNARFNMWQYAAVGGVPNGTTLEEPLVVPVNVKVVT